MAIFEIRGTVVRPTRRRVVAVGTAALLAVSSLSAYAQTAPPEGGEQSVTDPRLLPRDQRPAPDAPTVTADATKDGVRVSWHDAPAGAETFTVSRSSAGQAAAELGDGPQDGRSFFDSTVEPGQEYSYTVAVAEVSAVDTDEEPREATARPGQVLGTVTVSARAGEGDRVTASAQEVRGKRGEGRQAAQRVTAAAVPADDRTAVAAAVAPECQRSGTLAASETWSPADCPDGYEITADLLIPTGVVVTVAPGTLVRLDVAPTPDEGERDAVDILVEGSLVSAGTAEDPVVFTSAAPEDESEDTPAPAAGDWGNLAFLGSEGGSLSFTEIRYGNKVLADGFALPISDVSVRDMQGSDEEDAYALAGLDYRNVTDSGNVSIVRLSYDGVIGSRDDDPENGEGNDTGVSVTNLGVPFGRGADTTGFAVSVVDSTLTGFLPLFIMQNGYDNDSAVDLALTDNTITDTAASSAVFAGVYQGYGAEPEAAVVAGSAALTGAVGGNTITSAHGEGIYLEAQTVLSDVADGASGDACSPLTFSACNTVSLVDNAVSSSGSALMHYAWVDDGTGDVLSVAPISGGSYDAQNGYAADVENWTEGSGAARTLTTATDVTLSGADGAFSMAGSDGGPAVSSPVLDGVTLTSDYYGWDNEAYGSDGGDTGGDATASPVITDSSFTGAYTGLYNHAYSGAGSATANPVVSGSRLEGGSDAGLHNDADADGETGAATASPVIKGSTLDAGQYGDGLSNSATSEYGPAEGSPSVTSGSKLYGDWDGSGLYNEVSAGESASSVDPQVTPGPAATGNPLVSASHVEGYWEGIYNQVESGTGAATAAPQVVNGSSVESYYYGLENAAYAADDAGQGAAVATPTITDSSVRSEDDYALDNEAEADEGDSPADASFVLTRADLTSDDSYGAQVEAESAGTAPAVLNPQITSSAINGGDYGLYLELDTDEGPGSVGGFLTDSSISSYDEALYLDMSTVGGAAMTTTLTRTDLFSEYYEAVYLDVEDDLRTTDTDSDGSDDVAVTDGTSVTPTITDSRLRALDDDGLVIYAEGSGDDADDVIELAPVLEGVTITSYGSGVYLSAEDDGNYVADPDSGSWPGSVHLGGSIHESSIDSMDYYGIYAEADCYDCTGGSLVDLSAHNTDVFSYYTAGYFDAYGSEADATVASQLTSDRGSSWRSYDDDSVYSYADASGAGSTATNDMVVRGLHLGSYGSGVDLEAYSSSGDALNGSVIDDNVIDSPWGDNGYAGVNDYTYGGSYTDGDGNEVAGRSVRTGSISGNTISAKDEGIDHYVGRASDTNEFDSLIIAGNTISGVDDEGIEADGNGFAPEGGTTDFLLISGNTIRSTGDDGIDVSGLPTRIVNNTQSLAGVDGDGYAGIRVEDATVQGLVACNTVVGNDTGVEYDDNDTDADPLTNHNTFVAEDGTTNGLNIESDNAGTTDARFNFLGVGTAEELAETVNNDRNTEEGPQGTIDISGFLLAPPDCSTNPTAVTAVPGNASATVSWTPPASDRGSETTGYRVTAAPGGQTCSTSGLSCTVEGLTNGTSYTFTVVAINEIGDSPASEPSNAVTPTAPPTAPGAPTATAGDTTALVSFTAPSSDGGTPITGYLVSASPGGRSCTTSGELSCTVTGLTNGTAYTFTVTALNAAGTGATSAPSSSVVPVGLPAAPAAPTAVAGDTIATVSWLAPSSDGGTPITSYRAEADPGDGFCTSTGALTCTIAGLTNGTEYTFVVTATNAVGAGPASGASNAVTPLEGTAPPELPRTGRSSDGPPSPSNPVVVTITSPTPGQFSFTPVPASEEVGFDVVGVAMQIEAPDATVDDPLRMVFRIDASAIRAGVPVGVFRDGDLASACTSEGRAAPDPCQVSSTVLEDGDVEVVVLSSHASVWHMAQPDPGSIGAACSDTAASPFTDVNGNTHRAAIACLVAYDITRGTSATTYTPAGSVTRAQMASFIARLLREGGVALPAAASSGFGDIADNEHRLAIAQLATLGVVNGVTPTQYAPEATVSRAQMASFIIRAYELAVGQPVPATASSFRDIAGDTHEVSINKIAVLGVTIGADPTAYAPAGPVARDQMASFLARTMNLFVVGGQAPPA